MAGGDFLYLSAPKPIVTPRTPFDGDLQAWIRNSNLNPEATPTAPPSNNNDGCSIGAAPSANRRTLWFLLAPAATLWWTHRRNRILTAF